MSIIQTIKKLNKLYRDFKVSFDEMKKMFKNHSLILSKIKLSEKFLYQAYMLIKDKFENNEQKREFNRILKQIKNDQ